MCIKEAINARNRELQINHSVYSEEAWIRGKKERKLYWWNNLKTSINKQVEIENSPAI